VKKSEAATILAKIAAYDRRTVGEADVEAWTEALDGLVTVQDAMTAVRDHFRESSEWLMPVDIIKRSKALRFRRINAAGYPDFPPGLTQAQEREWLRVWHASLGRGSGAPAMAQLNADRELGVERVESDYVPTDRVRDLISEFADSMAIVARNQQHPADTQAGRA
jgi:hypothetical protein